MTTWDLATAAFAVHAIVASYVPTAHGHFAFLPRGSRSLRMSAGVKLPPELHACTSCGHMWASLDPEKLREFVERYGDELARQQADSYEGDFKGVPAGVVECVAEIDSLVSAGKSSEATRRFREFADSTWDRAVHALQGWRHLGREEKLAMFGYRPKELIPADDELA
jgi:hypothetical protein